MKSKICQLHVHVLIKYIKQYRLLVLVKVRFPVLLVGGGHSLYNRKPQIDHKLCCISLYSTGGTHTLYYEASYYHV